MIDACSYLSSYSLLDSSHRFGSCSDPWMSSIFAVQAPFHHFVHSDAQLNSKA
jgi:hypothetical protein